MKSKKFKGRRHRQDRPWGIVKNDKRPDPVFMYASCRRERLAVCMCVKESQK